MGIVLCNTRIGVAVAVYGQRLSLTLKGAFAFFLYFSGDILALIRRHTIAHHAGDALKAAERRRVQ